MSEKCIRRGKAAVLRQLGEPLSVEEVEFLELLPGQVVIKLAATGICHTDVHAMSGELPVPLPCVVGHEGAGVVEEIGPSVTMVKPGDHVVSAITASCGKCRRCTEGKPYFCELYAGAALGGTLVDGSIRLRGKDEGTLFHFICQSHFAEYAIVNERQLAKIPEEAPFTIASLLGCGISVGLSLAVNHAQVRPGDSVAVFGCGGVGLSIVMGASLMGAERIFAVDILPNKLELARELGATDLIDATTGDPVEQIGLLMEAQGVDYSFEAVGNPALMAQAVDVIRAGGMTTFIGTPAFGTTFSYDALGICFGKTITAVPTGALRPTIDIPHFMSLYLAGRLPLDKMVSKTYKLEEVNQAVEDLKGGKVARGVIVF